jgi:hypothetical protein
MQLVDRGSTFPARPLQGGRQLLSDVPFLDLLLVEVEDQPGQPDLSQPLGHSLDGGPLLSDKEHPLTYRGAGGDDVGDRLALPGAGRSHDDGVAAGGDGGDRTLLGRVCVEDQELVSRSHVVTDKGNG